MRIVLTAVSGCRSRGVEALLVPTLDGSQAWCRTRPSRSSRPIPGMTRWCSAVRFGRRLSSRPGEQWPGRLGWLPFGSDAPNFLAVNLIRGNLDSGSGAVTRRYSSKAGPDPAGPGSVVPSQRECSAPRSIRTRRCRSCVRVLKMPSRKSANADCLTGEETSRAVEVNR